MSITTKTLTEVCKHRSVCALCDTKAIARGWVVEAHSARDAVHITIPPHFIDLQTTATDDLGRDAPVGVETGLAWFCR